MTGTEPRMLSRWLTFGIALLVVLLDRVSKLYIERHVSAIDTIPVIPGFFNIVHTQNLGAAFGMFADAGSMWRGFLLIAVSGGVMLFVLISLWSPTRTGFLPSRLLSVALSLVLGGALGNLYDRLLRGSVTDFLQLFFGSYEFPSFNVADSAITVGAALLAIDMWRGRRQVAQA